MEYVDLIKIYLLIHGHSLDYKIISIDENMANYIVDLSSTQYETGKVILSPIRRKKVLQLGRDFYDTYFKVHDVLYCTERHVRKLNKKEMYDYNQALVLFNELGKLISPYKLPVHFKEKEETDGFLSMLYIDTEDEEFLTNMNPYFKYISLLRKPSEITPSSYIHELCHLQLESNKGSIVDYNNSEAFPIFLELVSLMGNEKNLQYSLNMRLDFLVREFDKLIAFYFESKGNIYDAFTTSKYIVSLLEALKLFWIYLNSSNSIRKEILESIQQVFDKIKTTEDVLGKYEISLESSLDINVIKKLMK